jgi:beta-aspartyl-peptidase (threonine type)
MTDDQSTTVAASRRRWLATTGSLLTVGSMSAVARADDCPTASANERVSGQGAAQTIEQLLQRQAEAWNAGDLAAFMVPYWHSDDLTFSSGGRITRGWQATLDRYRQRYPDRAAMGQLTFRDLEIRMLCDSAALVLGRWALDRETAPVGGNFSLVLARHGDQWRIIHDHTSQSKDH